MNKKKTEDSDESKQHEEAELENSEETISETEKPGFPDIDFRKNLGCG